MPQGPRSGAGVGYPDQGQGAAPRENGLPAEREAWEGAPAWEKGLRDSSDARGVGAIGLGVRDSEPRSSLRGERRPSGPGATDLVGGAGLATPCCEKGLLAAEAFVDAVGVAELLSFLAVPKLGRGPSCGAICLSNCCRIRSSSCSRL